jgi:hypothetical protein
MLVRPTKSKCRKNTQHLQKQQADLCHLLLLSTCVADTTNPGTAGKAAAHAAPVLMHRLVHERMLTLHHYCDGIRNNKGSQWAASVLRLTAAGK